MRYISVIINCCTLIFLLSFYFIIPFVKYTNANQGDTYLCGSTEMVIDKIEDGDITYHFPCCPEPSYQQTQGWSRFFMASAKKQALNISKN
jgi:hypothetical protein